MLNSPNHYFLRLKTVFLSKEFRVFFLISVALNEIIFHFDPFTYSIRTDADIIYDFSGSWRNHVSRLLNGEGLYNDFYYPYPPLGLYIISGIFYLTGPDIFHQTIATSIVAVIIHYGLFLLVETKVLEERFKTVVLITSLFFLNGTKHEIFLGGNPFPLVLGFAFFTFALVYSDKIGVSTILLLIAASCKHEFWIGAFLLIGYFSYRNYKVTIPIVLFMVVVNLALGYASLDIITGMGRSSWARWNFHWEGAVAQLLLFTPLIFFKQTNLYSLLYITIILILLHVLDPLLLLSTPVFLIPILLLLLTKTTNHKIIFIFILVFSLQMRRGFEWNEFSFECLLPICFACIITNIDDTRKLRLNLFLILLLCLSFYRFSLTNVSHISPVLRTNKYSINYTSIGKIKTPRGSKLISQMSEIINGKTVFSFPFCSGLNVLCGAENSSPISYFYNRDKIKTFDYYKKEMGHPDFLVIDDSFIFWNDYPKLQNPLTKWHLNREKINLLGKYPEVTDLVNKDYVFLKKIENFTVYARSN